MFTGDSYQLDSLEEMDIPELQWVVEGMLPEGLTFLYGKPKARKSWFAFAIALSVAGGEKFLGAETIEGEVLYIALEDGPLRMKQRAIELLKGKRFPKGVTVWHKKGLRLLGKGLEEDIAEHLNKNPGTKLVVIDTFGRARGAQANGGKSAYDVDVANCAVLQELAHTSGKAILMIHHQSKSERDDLFDTISGTLGLSGTADQLMVMIRERNTDEQVLHVTGRDLKEDLNYRLSFAGNSWARLKDQPKKGFKPLSLRERIVLWCEEHGGKISLHAFVSEKQEDMAQVTTRVRELVISGKLRKRLDYYELVT